MYNNQDYIVRVLLSSKIHNIPGHPKVTYKTLVSLFKSQFPWLSVDKLKYHAKKSKVSIRDLSQDSWVSILDPKDTGKKTSDIFIDEEDTDKSIFESPSIRKSKSSNTEIDTKKVMKSFLLLYSRDVQIEVVCS